MGTNIFSKDDLEQIRGRGMEPQDVLTQMELFKKGFPFMELDRPCTPGDGIVRLEKNQMDELIGRYDEAAGAGRAMKFVPASGAASRMYRLLLSFMNRCGTMGENEIRQEAEKGDTDHKNFLQFIEHLTSFAFYEDLKTAMEKDGLHPEKCLEKGQYQDILSYLLTSKGLDAAALPKGLITFHSYPDGARTPFEEHLVEAKHYVADRNGTAHIHFTISPEHEKRVTEHLEAVCPHHEQSGTRFDLAFSFQKPSTDTIAVDMENQPFRDKDGRFVFRPGGHGALLVNLDELKGDIIFIKNIDNVVPDRLKQETYTWKKVLGGYLVALQEEIFSRTDRLAAGDADEGFVQESMDFLRYRLSYRPPEGFETASLDAKVALLISRFNRPVRVCGMVRNEGEPGGGPFWIRDRNGGQSAQIVESAQVDMASEEQKAVWHSSTHFNPVDLVCGVRDYLGHPFDLLPFRDPDTGFISAKSKDGRDLKALELPGLWNGAMADWNTAFIEVPLITFNPVKIVLDLLRPEHQPA